MNLLLDRRSVDADDVVGNFIGGDVSGTLVQNFIASGVAPQEPSLVWQDLPDDPGEIFRMLTWHVRLTDVYGRAREMGLLRDWIGQAGSPRVRIRLGAGWQRQDPAGGRICEPDAATELDGGAP